VILFTLAFAAIRLVIVACTPTTQLLQRSQAVASRGGGSGLHWPTAWHWSMPLLQRQTWLVLLGSHSEVALQSLFFWHLPSGSPAQAEQEVQQRWVRRP
jgi:hypothetical protein